MQEKVPGIFASLPDLQTSKYESMLRMIISVLVFCLPPFIPLFSQSTLTVPPDRPKLIVGIVVDQMRYDYIYRYWDKFGEGGFRRLIDEGTFCKNARFSYLNTYSATGYATISTGSMPASHGIIADEWYKRLQKEKIYCTQDEGVKAVGGSYENGMHSPVHLVATTLGDELRMYFNMRSKVFGVGMKEHAAILSAGHTANAAYWFDASTGTWMSSTWYLDSLPQWVREFNEKEFPDLYLEREWEPLYPEVSYVESLPDSCDYETGLGGRNVFPYDLDRISRVRRRERDYGLLGCVPFGNTYTKDFAVSLIVSEQLGKDKFPDLLTVAFNPPGEVGRLFGPNSMEMQDVYLRLDRDLEHFLEFLDQQVGKKNVLVYLTSNHGVSASPAYLKTLRIPGDFFNLNGAVTLLRAYLNVIYGNGNWVDTVIGQQIFLNRQLIEDSKLSLEEMQNRVARFMIQISGVARAVTSTSLESNYFGSGMMQRIQNGYNQKRSGDVILSLEPGWISRNGDVAGHSTAYRYDSHVPLIWYGWKIPRMVISDPVDMTGLASTVAFLMNISYPNGNMEEPLPGLISR